MAAQITSESAHKSHGVSLYPLVAALKQAERFVGHNRVWTPAGAECERQRPFLAFFPACRRALPDLDCLAAVADRDIEAINRWLRARGWDMRLRQPPGPGGFAMASALDLLLTWPCPGTESSVSYADQVFLAFALREGVKLWQTASSPHPLVSLQAQEGYRVLIRVADSTPGQGLDLLHAVLDLRRASGAARAITAYDRVTIPMVSLSEEIDLSWVHGLETVGEDDVPTFVSEAAGQHRFRMNQQGARAESGVAVGVRREISSSRADVVDRPFYLWIDPLGTIEAPPVFAAYLAPDTWRDPSTLSAA